MAHTLYLFCSYVGIKCNCTGDNESGQIQIDGQFIVEAIGSLKKVIKFIKPNLSPTYEAIAASGYHLTEFLVDDIDIFPLTSGVFENIAENHTLVATFVAD